MVEVNSRPSSFLLHSTFWGRTAYISDLTKSTTYYKIECRNRKPHFTFYDDSGKAIATSNTNLGKSLEFVVHGREFKIELYSLVIASEFRYNSPGLCGQEIVWKSASSIASGEIVCTDGNGKKLGRFLQRSLGRDVGTLDFEEDIKTIPGLTDEMLVVGMALAWHRLFQSSMMLGVASAIA